MNSQSPFRAVFSKKLSEVGDYKLLQVVVLHERTIYFEIRQTIGGSYTGPAVGLTLPLFRKFKEYLLGDKSSCRIDYADRILIVNKTLNEVAIQAQQTGRQNRLLVLNDQELLNLRSSLNEIEKIMESLYQEKGYNSEMKEFKEYIF